MTGIESAITQADSTGPLIDSQNVAGPKFVPAIYSLPYLTRDKCPTNTIRIYRTVKNGDLVGAGDSTVYYCELEIAVDRASTKYDGTVVRLGAVPDSFYLDKVTVSELTSGNVGAYGTRSSLAAESTASPSLSYYDEENFPKQDGEYIIRPPVVGPLRVPFKDMEYSGTRLWGIGDPVYPQRLYYSGIDDINDWNPVYYLSMDENDNDELVAIEKVEGSGGDYLYPFKHNSIYAVTGVDPEYDLSVRRLTADCGAKDRWSVIKVRDGIFFMATDKKIYLLDGGQIKYISAGIQDYVDSVFTGAVRTFCLDDKVDFWSVAKSKAVSFNLLTGTWTVETFALSIKPVGSFLYDTIQGVSGFSDNSWWIWEDDANAYLRKEYDGYADTCVTPPCSRAINYEVAYQTPYCGDGNWIIKAMGLKASITADSGFWAIADVYDQADQKIATDSLLFDGGRDWGEQYFWFPPNSSRYFSVRIRGNYHELRNVEVYWVRMGKAPAR